MREANWDEIFARRTYDEAERDDRLSLIIPWEDWLTFIITGIVFLSVIHSIDSANWVDNMPSLYPVALLALVVGYAISRIRVNELLLYPIALLIGTVVVFFQLMAVIPGGSLYVRTDALVDRMYVWWSAATQGGISNDELPFIVLILTACWAGAFFSSWSIFRWRNAWLGLIPAGTALMWNISFIPGQFSYSFVFFVFGAVLLVMRMHLARKEREWEANDVAYPEFMSLSVLNATFWVAVGLLIAVWILPLAHRSESASERWRDFTQPYTERLAPLARVFISVDAKRPIDVHNLKGALPLQGNIKLSNREAVKLNVEITPEMAAYLRSQAFDEYTAAGWKLEDTRSGGLPAGARAEEPAAAEGTRQEVTVTVEVVDGDDKFLFSLGQPLSSDRASIAQVGPAQEDVTALKPRGRLEDGDTYAVTGSVAVPSVEQLRAAGTDYPRWVERAYLQLPDRLPDRVRDKADEVTRNAQTPYDKAIAVERYLRTFPNDYKVPAAPSGRDSVDYFLFDAQRGYFDYHASAMAVLLRAEGVPARVAVGYVIDEARRDPETNHYTLTEKQAFAWPEVYFPGVGWVEFNPTPTQPLIRRPGASDEPPAVDDSPAGGAQGLDEEDLLDLGGVSGGVEEDAGALADEGDGGGMSPLIAVFVLAAIGGAFALVLTGGRFAWEFGLGGLPRAGQLWEKTMRLASWSQVGPKPSDTPREFASMLRDQVPGTRDASYLAAAYERTRFGQKELSEDEQERLETAWVSVRNRLVRHVLHRRRP